MDYHYDWPTVPMNEGSWNYIPQTFRPPFPMPANPYLNNMEPQFYYCPNFRKNEGARTRITSGHSPKAYSVCRTAHQSNSFICENDLNCNRGTEQCLQMNDYNFPLTCHNNLCYPEETRPMQSLQQGSNIADLSSDFNYLENMNGFSDFQALNILDSAFKDDGNIANNEKTKYLEQDNTSKEYDLSAQSTEIKSNQQMNNQNYEIIEDSLENETLAEMDSINISQEFEIQNSEIEKQNIVVQDNVIVTSIGANQEIALSQSRKSQSPKLDCDSILHPTVSHSVMDTNTSIDISNVEGNMNLTTSTLGFGTSTIFYDDLEGKGNFVDYEIENITNEINENGEAVINLILSNFTSSNMENGEQNDVGTLCSVGKESPAVVPEMDIIPNSTEQRNFSIESNKKILESSTNTNDVYPFCNNMHSRRKAIQSHNPSIHLESQDKLIQGSESSVFTFNEEVLFAESNINSLQHEQTVSHYKKTLDSLTQTEINTSPVATQTLRRRYRRHKSSQTDFTKGSENPPTRTPFLTGQISEIKCDSVHNDTKNQTGSLNIFQNMLENLVQNVLLGMFSPKGSTLQYTNISSTFYQSALDNSATVQNFPVAKKLRSTSYKKCLIPENLNNRRPRGNTTHVLRSTSNMAKPFPSSRIDDNCAACDCVNIRTKSKRIARNPKIVLGPILPTRRTRFSAKYTAKRSRRNVSPIMKYI